MTTLKLKWVFAGMLAIVLAACSGSSNSSSSGEIINPPSPGKLSPIFHGLRSIATAGGASVRLDWSPALDGETAQSMLRYRVFVSATPGGQNFSTPTLTTAPGAGSVILSSGDTPLIAVGARAYYVVRSLDGDGNSDGNKVELSTVPVAPGKVAFVDDQSESAGALGDPTNRFSTIQDAVSAVESAGGGAVLVSADAGGTTYTEEVDLTDNGVSSIGVYGGFPRFGAGSGGSPTLSARDPVGHATIISAMGVALLHGATIYDGNGFRPAFFDGFELTDQPGYAVRGSAVDLQVSGCILHEGSEILLDAPSPLPTVLEQAGPAAELRIVGNVMTDPSPNVACDIGGLVALAYFQNNDIQNYRQGVYLGGFLVSSFVIPTATGADINISDNRFVGLSDYGIDTNFDPQSTSTGSTLTMVVDRNEIRNIDDDFANIDGLGNVGNNGSAHLAVRNNLLVGGGDDLVDVVVPGNNPTPIGRNVTVDISDNAVLNTNDDGINCEMEPSQNGTSTLNVARNLIANCESYPLDIYDTSPSSTDLGNGAHMVYNIQDNVHPGGGEEWYIEGGVAHGGRTDITLTGNTTLTPADDYGLELRYGARLGQTSAMPSVPDGVTGVVVFNNEIHGSDYVAANFSDERDDNGSALYGLVANNILGFVGDTSYIGLEMYTGDPGDTTWLMQRNFFGVGGQDDEPGLQLSTSGANNSQIRLLNNVFAFTSGPGIAVDSTGVRPQIINDTVAFNNQNDSDPSIDAIQCYIHNCIVSHTGYRDLDPNAWASYSLLREQSPATSGYNNVTGEPLYVNSGSSLVSTPVDVAAVIQNIFTLAPQSPAVDAGDPDSIYNDTNGTRNDMGAYGGPGAGTMGVLTPAAKVPFVFVGMSPKPDLAGGSGLPYNDDTLLLILSHPVNVATIAGNVTVTSNGAAVPGTFGTGYGGNAITFEPDTTLDANGSSILSITLGTGLKDTDGNALAYRSSFRIGVVPQDASATPETEPNNDTTTAQSLGIGPGRGTAYLSCTFAGSADADVYSFTADAGRRLTAAVGYRRISNSAPGNALLELLDSTGSVIAAGTPTFEDDPYLDFTLPAAGTYYLRVMNPGSSEGEQYSLQVQSD